MIMRKFYGMRARFVIDNQILHDPHGLFAFSLKVKIKFLLLRS